MTSAELDLSALAELADDLRDLTDKVLPAVRPAVARGALKVKAAMQADLAESRHFGQVANTVSYDTRTGSTWVEAEVGPRSGGAGALAGFAYFGGANGGGGTVRDPLDAALDEAPHLEKAISDIVDGLL